MTTPALDTAVDPTGLNGERVHRNEAHRPDVVEIWSYSSIYSFDAIEQGWKAAPRRTPRTLVMSVTPHQQRAGRLYVQVRLYEEPAPAPVRIDEPNV